MVSNYMQRIGNSKCVRCYFETNVSDSFETQDAKIMEHLEKEHPNWLFNNGSDILPERLPKSNEKSL